MPTQIINNHKVGIFLEDLVSNEKKLLGSLDPIHGYDLRVGGWYFSEFVLSWGNECLLNASGHDVVIFDECGPLELIEKKGFKNGLALFDHQQFKLGIVVIRPELITMATHRWPEASVYLVKRPQI